MASIAQADGVPGVDVRALDVALLHGLHLLELLLLALALLPIRREFEAKTCHQLLGVGHAWCFRSRAIEYENELARWCDIG
jgi:hypothetical protein